MTVAKKRASKKAATPVKAKAPAGKTAVKPAAKKTVKKTVKKVARKTAAPKAKTSAKPGAKAPARSRAKAPAKRSLADVVAAALDEMKGQNITVLDVRGVTDVADTIIIASGTSDRHVKSLATRVQERAREAGYRPLGVEGEREGEWVLVDLGDVIAHLMLPRVREFYALEKLWNVRSAERTPAN
jgi:ribosome-associated protein